jgi:hypothetical protein
MIAVLGGIFTMIYTLKIDWFLSFSHHWYHLRLFHINQLSFLLPWLTISSIFIDQSLSYCFSYSCSVIYYSIDYSSLFIIDCILDFSLVPIILSFIRFFLFLFDGWHEYNRLFMIFIFSSSSVFFVLPFQYFYLLYSCFFFKGPIHLIEVYTDYPSYHIYYYSSSLISIFFFFLFLLTLFLL